MPQIAPQVAIGAANLRTGGRPFDFIDMHTSLVSRRAGLPLWRAPAELWLIDWLIGLQATNQPSALIDDLSTPSRHGAARSILIVHLMNIYDIINCWPLSSVAKQLELSLHKLTLWRCEPRPTIFVMVKSHVIENSRFIDDVNVSET